ncbi:hypothetical protein [Nocardia terpenica]|uniref:hypothetical protein n=1 Tax=Nocardia terpenica TaxID=455432 RepID=UPI001933585D|nr:hypothetical protein [Nocardia terpenica]
MISVGSLSKILWGGMRVGWVRAPIPIIARLSRLRAVHDLGGNIPAQLAAARLLPELDHLRDRIIKERKESHDTLISELTTRIPDWQIPPVPGGQTLWICLPHGDGTSFAQRALRHGVAILPGSGLDPSGASTTHIRISFVATPPPSAKPPTACPPPGEHTNLPRDLSRIHRHWRCDRLRFPLKCRCQGGFRRPSLREARSG